jgi:hypothetical protein
MWVTCVEAFWQSLRFPLEERARIAGLDGPAAKRAAGEQPYASTILYGGEAVATGNYDHWQLMRRACEAKFAQNDDARAALLGTGNRPLVHSVRRDSRTIPGVIMADLWMRLRTKLRQNYSTAEMPFRQRSRLAAGGDVRVTARQRETRIRSQTTNGINYLCLLTIQFLAMVL